MEEVKYGLGEAALSLDLNSPMRSRVPDALVLPPEPQNLMVERRFDPRVIADRISSALAPGGPAPEFEARFYLSSGKGLTLRGDKEGFGSIQPMEPFTEVPERLLEIFHLDIVKVELFLGGRRMIFSSYEDLLEWAGME